MRVVLVLGACLSLLVSSAAHVGFTLATGSCSKIARAMKPQRVFKTPWVAATVLRAQYDLMRSGAQSPSPSWP